MSDEIKHKDSTTKNYYTMKRLNGNVTLITGGGKGIGYGLAEAFAEEGSNLVITGRTESRLVEAKQKLEEKYGEGSVTLFTEFGPIVGTHIGRGGLGILYKLKTN